MNDYNGKGSSMKMYSFYKIKYGPVQYVVVYSPVQNN